MKCLCLEFACPNNLGIQEARTRFKQSQKLHSFANSATSRLRVETRGYKNALGSDERGIFDSRLKNRDYETLTLNRSALVCLRSELNIYIREPVYVLVTVLPGRNPAWSLLHDLLRSFIGDP